MKAVVCKQFCSPDELVIEEVASPQPDPKQVVIGVKGCGINFPDGLIVQGKYQTKPVFPFTPGSEVSGVVRYIGSEVRGLEVGARVIGFTGMGGLAEEVAVDAQRVYPIPDSMDFATAAGFLVTYGTSHHALKDRAGLKPGETLLVLGAAGGVGLAAVQIGKAMGAKVLAAASSDEKLALCSQHGADELLNYSSGDLREQIKKVTGGKGVDVVYDPVGGPDTEPMVRSLNWSGRYLVVGFAAGGEIPKIPLNLVLLKSAALLGVLWGAFAKANPGRQAGHVLELLSWYLQGKIKPHVSAVYPLARAGEALNHVMTRKVLGKIVVVNERPPAFEAAVRVEQLA
jgi:NADPH2:quinone reductase